MQPYDMLMLFVLGAGTLLGVRRGLVWQVASVLAVVASVLVATRYSGVLALHVSESATLNRALAMLVLYLVTSLAIWSGFRLVSGVVAGVRLDGLDRELGALVGAGKGALWCLVITFFAVTISSQSRKMAAASQSGYYIAALLHHGGPLLPDDVRDAIGGYLDQLDRGLDPAVDPLPDVSAALPKER